MYSLLDTSSAEPDGPDFIQVFYCWREKLTDGDSRELLNKFVFSILYNVFVFPSLDSQRGRVQQPGTLQPALVPGRRTESVSIMSHKFIHSDEIHCTMYKLSLFYKMSLSVRIF